MYSEAEAHLTNLDFCGSRILRRAYLLIVLAAERAGYHTGPKDAERELKIRDGAGRQPFLMVVHADRLLFCLRAPAFEDRPALAGEARNRFEGRLDACDQFANDVRIRINAIADAEDVVDWLFPLGGFSPGYGERRSA
ncbi:MAG: hypothetical protein H7268_11210 [Sandarakinorhabdus sp.]|nr:hypothetical protein [Sandarakinorhabdus sp.]